MLGGAAVFGSQTGAPAMASLRGLFGRRGSMAPTVLNIAQNIGWATMEIIVISQAAVAVTSERWRWLFVLLAGVIATAMAVRPLGSVKLLRKFMVWLVLIASVYLFIQVLSKPVHDLPQDGVFGFWPGVDLAAAGVVSFAPLAADYTRHSRTNKAAFAGSALGYGLAAILYYALGVLAVATLQTNSTDVITALVTLPAGAIALFVLLVDEVDEAYANVYSTTMAAHNLVGHIDRRWISVVIGVLATGLALLVDLGNYTQFLYLIGSVFIPLVRGRDRGLLRGQQDALGRFRHRAVPLAAHAGVGLRLRRLPAGQPRHGRGLVAVLARRAGRGLQRPRRYRAGSARPTRRSSSRCSPRSPSAGSAGRGPPEQGSVGSRSGP